MFPTNSCSFNHYPKHCWQPLQSYIFKAAAFHCPHKSFGELGCKKLAWNLPDSPGGVPWFQLRAFIRLKILTAVRVMRVEYGFALDGLFWQVHAPKWCPKMSCIYLQDHHFRVFSRIVWREGSHPTNSQVDKIRYVNCTCQCLIDKEFGHKWIICTVLHPSNL